MVVVDSTDMSRALLIGPADGASTIFRARFRFQAGFFVGLHAHHGDESFEVRDGVIRFTIDGEHYTASPGDIVFVPPDTEHGFLVLADSTLDVFSQQRTGLFLTVIERDGSRRVEEIFTQQPWSRALPPDTDYTPWSRVQELYATTRHLL